MNEIQADLPIGQYTRNMMQVEALFSASFVDLERIILDTLRSRRGYSRENPFTLVDLGCGSGTAIEEYAQSLMMEHIPGHCLRTVGIDRSLLTHLIPPGVLRRSRGGDGFLTEFIEHDLNLGVPLRPNSVDVFYAAELINYLNDSLGFLEYVYPCLRTGGVAVVRTAPWAVAYPERQERELPDYKTFLSIILKNIPYARHIFEIVYDEHFCGGVIIMRKIPEVESISFGCRIHRIVPGEELCFDHDNPAVRHVRSAVYRTLKGRAIPTRVQHDFPVRYIVDCPL